MFRKLFVAKLAESEIAQTIIVDPTIADCRADPTKITKIVDDPSPLKSKLMTNRTAFLRARWHSTTHTVQLLTNPAHRPA